MSQVRAVGAVVRDQRHRFLLVRRANDPEAGRWTIPGGRVEPGESLPEATRREVYEETGLIVSVGAELGVLEIPYGEGTLEIHDFAASSTGGTLAAGDDAVDAGWFSVDEMRRLALTSNLLEALAAFGVIEQHS